jgi:hypothetical protein
VGRYLPFALPVNACAVLAVAGNDDMTPATCAAKCVVLVAFTGLVLLVSSAQAFAGLVLHLGEPRPRPTELASTR